MLQVKATGNQGKNEALAWIKGVGKDKHLAACAGSQSWMCVRYLRSLLDPMVTFSFAPEQMYKQGQDRSAAPDVLAAFYQRRLSALPLSIFQLAAASSLFFIKRRPAVGCDVSCGQRGIGCRVCPGSARTIIRGVLAACRAGSWLLRK
jgi:hypothetical protein